MEKNNFTNVIPFPNAKQNQQFKEQQQEINGLYNRLETAFDLPCWDKVPCLLPCDIDILANFGETIKFSPHIAARVITTLAKQIKQSNLIEEEIEYDT